VLVYDAAGQKVEQISVPARPTNVEFGGSHRKTLFITTDSGSLSSIGMRVQGVAPRQHQQTARPAKRGLDRWPDAIHCHRLPGSVVFRTGFN
jgi:hypothetical protein